MATVNTLDGLFKDVFGDGTIRAVPDFAKIQKRVKFSQKEKTGDFYEVPVLLGYEHGFTYASDGAGAVTLNAAVAGNVKKARVQGNMIFLRSQLSYEDVMKAASAGPAAFESATGLVVDNMERSFAKRLELSFLYGQQGLGEVDSVTSGVIVLKDPSFAGGIWTGMKDCILQAWNAIAASATQHDGDLVVSAVDHAAKTVTVTGTSSSVVADDHLYFDGARTSSAHNECAGLDKILTNTGTLFNIDASVFELWKATTRTVGSEISMLSVLNGIADAANKGLDSDAVLWISPANWNKLNSDQSALRRYGAEINAKASNGTKAICYYSTNGKTEIEAHPMVKDGDGLLIAAPDKRLLRVGASDITFRRPGLDETIFRELTDSAGIELRAMCDQSIVHQTPAQCVKYAGIVAPS